MYARIIDGLVAEITKDMPELGPTECAHIVEVGPGVRVGWIWTPGGCVPPPEPPAPDPNAAVNAAILALECTVTQRRLREAALTEAGKAWLADVDAQIAALRKGMV